MDVDDCWQGSPPAVGGWLCPPLFGLNSGAATFPAVEAHIVPLLSNWALFKHRIRALEHFIP